MRTVRGSNLSETARQFGIPKYQWIDLSTAINNNGYPAPDIPAECFQQRPDDTDELLSIAYKYYQTQSLVVAPGTQRLIQSLPLLRTRCRVATPDTGYHEYQNYWRKAGHSICEYNALEIDTLSDLIKQQKVDVAVVINPNDTTATLYPNQVLLEWANNLAHQDGWLIVDEAFIDAYDDFSLMKETPRPGLIVLRTLSHFFGLAGLRVGFASAPHTLLETLEDELGFLSVSGPARWLAIQALSDHRWIQQTRERLLISSLRMQQALYQSFSKYLGRVKISNTPLFISVYCDNKLAEDIYFNFCQQGILIHFTQSHTKQAYLRFGVIDYEDTVAWKRFLIAAGTINQAKIMDLI